MLMLSSCSGGRRQWIKKQVADREDEVRTNPLWQLGRKRGKTEHQSGCVWDPLGRVEVPKMER